MSDTPETNLVARLREAEAIWITDATFAEIKTLVDTNVDASTLTYRSAIGLLLSELEAWHELAREAADALTRLQQENAELRKLASPVTDEADATRRIEQLLDQRDALRPPKHFV